MFAKPNAFRTISFYEKVERMKNGTIYIALIAVNFLYACESLCTKYASQQIFLSWKYCLGMAGAVGILGAYAICWQQILKRVELSTAYMFKGTSLIFVMLLAFALLGEAITATNIIGAIVIVGGIMLFASEEPRAKR